MGRDSSGTYTRTQSDYSFNTVISETQINSELNDIASELTLSLEASGKKAWTGNQNCGSQKMTALAVGSALTDSTNLGQVQNGGMQYATGSGTNTIVATMAPAITAYVAGQTFRIKMAAGANTGATTLNLNSVGAKNITKRGTTALAAGDIPASMMFEVAYDGTQFQLINVGQDIDTDTGITSLVADSSPQLGGFLDANGNYIQMQKGGDIASESPTVIDTDGDYFICTGTTNFSAFTVAADRHFFLEFAAVLTMTHGAGTLDLPGGANITTAAGDVGEFFSTASNVVTCVNYAKKSGKPIITNFATSDIAANAIDETLIKDAFVADFTEVVVASGDSFLLGDASDSGNTKRDTVAGILSLAQSLDATPDTDHTANGPQTNTLNAGYGSAIMDLVFLGSGGKWLEADADATSTSINLLGMALEAKTDGQAMNVALAGSFVRDDTFNWTPGVPLYVSGTLGAITATKPSGSGDVVRTVGYAVTADVIFFNPSSDYVTLA